MPFSFNHCIFYILIGCMATGCGNPREKPSEAYFEYVRAVEEGDYASYKDAVEKPMPQDEFTIRYDQRKRKNLSSIKKEAFPSHADNTSKNLLEFYQEKVISPWDGKEIRLQFKKNKNSWEVCENTE